jgi:hypothetical protein
MRYLKTIQKVLIICEVISLSIIDFVLSLGFGTFFTFNFDNSLLIQV